jgi:hypothetical protein
MTDRTQFAGNDVVKAELSEDGKLATLTVSLDPSDKPETSSGKAVSLGSSHGWIDLGPNGARYSLNVVLSHATAAQLAAKAAETEAKPEPKPRTRTVKAAA